MSISAAAEEAAIAEAAAIEAAAAVATAAAAGLNLFSRQNLCSGEQDQAVRRAVGGGLLAG